MDIEIRKGDQIIPVSVTGREVRDNEEEHTREWLLFNNDYDIEIRFLEEYNGIIKKIISYPGNLAAPVEDLEILIESFLTEKLENTQSGFDHSEEDEEEGIQPYDPSKIDIVNNNWSVSHIFELLDKWGEIELSPQFQRNMVWDHKRRSQLIPI